MMVKFFSSSAYRAIRESKFLLLPSETTIQSYMVPRRETGISQIRLSELTQKASNLPIHEREVSVIFDEMALQPNINFDASGQMTGFALNQPSDSTQLATSMLCFMIQGLRKNFHEIVSFHPVHNMDANFMQVCFCQVIFNLMKAGFQPLLSVCDNHSTNRKLYRKISGKTDLELAKEPYTINPYDANQKLILSHDPVHVLKCLRNNWFRKPDWDVGEGRNISWAQINSLFEHELSLPVRKAPTLTFKGKLVLFYI
jgi:hypothetical protein